MTRAIERTLYDQMRAAEELERKARETVSEAQKAYAAARRVYVRQRAEWLNAFEELEKQQPSPIHRLALGGVR